MSEEIPVDGPRINPRSARYDLDGRSALVATMHGKERVIAPVLREHLGLFCTEAVDFDTDRFGTFTREIDRTGSQRDAARAKAIAALSQYPSATIAIASEGSFGPHPGLPFAAVNVELVMLVDRTTGLEIVGQHVAYGPAFVHDVVFDLNSAEAFAARVGFPRQGLVVMGCAAGQPSPLVFLAKGIVTAADLAASVREAIVLCGAAFLETDLRAHMNPTRMLAIQQAARDLARRYLRPCPDCGLPGYDITERIPGLPCEWCRLPTRVVKTEVYQCEGCGFRVEQSAGPMFASPGECGNCNP